MVTSQNSSNSGLQGINEESSMAEVYQPRIPEMLVWLKELALDPCNSKVTKNLGLKLWNQNLRLRKILSLDSAECPQRKRKLQQLLNCSKFSSPSGFSSERLCSQNVKRPRSGVSSCLPSSVDTTECSKVKTVMNSSSSNSILTFEDSFQAKQLNPNLSCLNNATDCSLSNKDSSFLVDKDRSVNCSNHSIPQEKNVEAASVVQFSNLIHRSDSTGLQKKRSQAVKFLKVAYKTQPVIPVGPRFQAEVPKWTDSCKPGNRFDDGDSEKWLGTRVWPMKGGSAETIGGEIGKGRPDACLCLSRGSAKCIKHHILEARLRLRSKLGPAFLSWKFDEMGDGVTQSWTLKEQRKFESLMNTNPLWKKGSFWEHAPKHFPSKCQKNIMSYYYNVFIPRRMSQLTADSLVSVDSDEDQFSNQEEDEDDQEEEDEDDDAALSIAD